MLDPRQGQLRGLVVGPGTKYRWADGPPQWWTDRDLRTSDTPLAGAHGIRGGKDRYGAQTLTGTLHLLGDDETDLGELIDAVEAAFAPSDDDLEFTTYFLGRERVRFGRARKLAVTVADSPVSDTATAVFQFDALDPFEYSADEHSLSSGPAEPGAGFSVPFTPPFSLPAGTVGIIPATNAGTAPAPWVATIEGPSSGIKLTNLTSGDVLDLSANGGLVLADGDTLTLDSRDRSVTLNGTASRSLNLSVGARWWWLDPDATPIQFDADGGTLTLAWRDAWY
jgi:hypothetical protein